MKTSRNVCDIWLHYIPSTCLGRRVAWASDNREVGWISLPVPRTSIAENQRDDDAAHWAASTHSSCYTNIAQAPWESLSHISPDDKAKVSGSDPKHTPVTPCDTDRGMPHFWTESKSIALWSDLLHCLDARRVADLSLGSGMVARAAMQLYHEYIGCCNTDTRARWMPTARHAS